MKASPFRVGIDLVAVQQVRESLERYGQRYLQRIFTDDEQSYCLSLATAQAQIASLSARFAAKEATMKVLRIERGIDWRQIEVRRWPEGYCDLVLSGEAALLAQERGICTLSLSLSHEAEYATAIVIADFF
ncbi:holo-ACP synthase [Tengunoibacter tsumagoiensis]|uniref:Holo-[acyl-carrier-protein] synthase n=1 Tax=Tengunoibacter tsumagoiensis TaxID=2014871 RepID=A0A401ZY23_9CHLR|nr:holo-ACP synthase [Tengunoibacter tsumagoiensis]GCE11735.1 holo-[acyl-carrier-protein] synthase [Tengunoibacter tsumagoiensis]